MALSILWYALAFLSVAAGAGLAYSLWRLGRLLREAERSTARVVDETIPLIQKTGVSLDTVNTELGKVDIMMDSAVSMTQALDTTVRGVSVAVTSPVRKVAGVVAGVNEAVTSLYERVSEDFSRPADDDGDGSTP